MIGTRVHSLQLTSFGRLEQPAQRLSKLRSYNDLHAYAFSNLCRIWWAKALSKRVPYPVVCLHPGVAAGTAMLQHMGRLTQTGRKVASVKPPRRATTSR